MAETRESVILDITLLTRFATVQRFKDVNNSAFSRSRVDADLSAFNLLRNPSMPALSRGFLDSHFDPKTSKGKQRSVEILDAFATIFAGSGNCVAVGVIRDWEKRVVQMIIGGNGKISACRQQQIHDLYMGLKEIAAAAERIAPRQLHSTHSDVLKDSPPPKTYQNDSLCVAKHQEFQAMVIQYCIKKIAQRFKKYGRLFAHVDDYLTPIFRERCGIETYLVYFQRLRPVIEGMLSIPAYRKDEKWMGYVLFMFQKMQLARKEIDFEALNDELLSKDRLKNQTRPQIRDRVRLNRSFQKLLITTDSATVLTKMALSPNLRSIFGFEFQPVYLPEYQGLAPSNDVDLWMRRFQAMSISGSRSEDGEQTQGRRGARGSEDVEKTRGSEDGKQTCGAQGSEGDHGSEDVEESHESEDGKETGFEGGGQTRGSQSCGGDRGSEDVEETRGSQDGKENGSEDSEQTRGSQGCGGARGSEDVEEIRGSKDRGETGFEDGESQAGASRSEDAEENGSEDSEQTRGSQGSGEARGSEDIEETRGFEDGGETGFEDVESQGNGGATGSGDVEETRRSQDGEVTVPADGEDTRESEDGKETGSKNGEKTHGSENGREARRSKFDIRSELMNCIREAISEKASCQVHAEVKVLGYLHRHGLIDKAINSVGISKLCCPACLGYISVMDIPIQVKGTHNKWYPWHLCPSDELLSLDQLRSMKESILRDFKFDWMKHLSDARQRSLSFGNHSESSSGDAEPDDGMSVFKMSYDIDKAIQGDYIKEFEESMEHSFPKQLVRSIPT